MSQKACVYAHVARRKAPAAGPQTPRNLLGLCATRRATPFGGL